MSLTQSNINKNTHDIDLYSFYMRSCVGDPIKVCQTVRRSIRSIHTNFQSENFKKMCLIYTLEKASVKSVAGVLMNLLEEKKQLINTTTTVLHSSTENTNHVHWQRSFDPKKDPLTNKKISTKQPKTQITLVLFIESRGSTDFLIANQRKTENAPSLRRQLSSSSSL